VFDLPCTGIVATRFAFRHTFRAFGENEFAARSCTGLAGYLSLATVFLLGRKLWESTPA
jgi:hypothetical protein